MSKDLNVGIIGLGYVGLPLAIVSGKKHNTVGFDINQKRIEELKAGYDHTLEVDTDEINSSIYLKFSADKADMKDVNLYIVTVPTPIDTNNNPDLRPIRSASEMVGKLLSKGDIVVYESTVYPGCTEEVCVPILEQRSGLSFNKDFFCGYSPERINPGDKERRIDKITKVTSGSTAETAEIVDNYYKSIISAGTFKTSSIKVAEASKVIENAQRDINIAFINELAIIFDRLSLNTLEVLEAAGTKWNFLNFRPGLVGGHCIGVDPYYLTHKAESMGYMPEVILAGRRINDNMGKFIASSCVKLMASNFVNIVGSKVLVMGITFKENCPDIRNSRVIDIIDELRTYNIEIDVYDPLADQQEVSSTYNIDMIPSIRSDYNAIIVAVAHDEFKKIEWSEIKVNGCLIYDVKGFLPPGVSDKQL